MSTSQIIANSIAESKENKNKPKITPPICSKYERSKLLQVRSWQLSAGYPALVDVGKEIDTYKIALMELKSRVNLPLIVRRILPDGSYEDWKKHMRAATLLITLLFGCILYLSRGDNVNPLSAWRDYKYGDAGTNWPTFEDTGSELPEFQQAEATSKQTLKGNRHDDGDDDDDNDNNCDTIWHDFVDAGIGTTGSLLVYHLTKHPGITVGAVNPGTLRSYDPSRPGFSAWFTFSGSGAGPIVHTDNPEHNPQYSRELSVAAGGHLGGVPQFSPEAQVFGGCTATNGGVQGTCLREYWDKQVRDYTGDAGYDYNYLLRARRSVEIYQGVGASNLTCHGTTGRMHTAMFAPEQSTLVFEQSISEVLGIPQIDMLCGSSNIGVGHLARNLKVNVSDPNPVTRSKRENVFYSLFNVVNGKVIGRPNLFIYENYKATKFVMDSHNPKKVRCIIIAGKNGSKRLCARKSVILTAGTIGNTQLLQLNGVGDCAYLKSINVPCLLNNSNIGKHVKNQASLSTLWLVPTQPRIDTSGSSAYHLSPLAKSLGQTIPDLQYASTQLFQELSPGQSLLLIVVQQNRYRDEGTIKIASDSFDKNPDIRYNYAVNFPDDRKALAYNLLKLREIMANMTAKGYPATEISASAAWTDEVTILANIDSVRAASTTAAAPTTQPFYLNWHHTSSDRMGPAGDPTRAVTPRGVVVGSDGRTQLQGLYVCGVDTLPNSAGCHAGESLAFDMAHFCYKFIMERYYPHEALRI